MNTEINPQSNSTHCVDRNPRSISLIIPVLNEAQYLARTLEALDPSRVSPAPLEVIVVDGGSHDRTLEIARSFTWAKVIAHRRRGRALQMNAGARAAQGEVLLFLHADVILPAGA